MAFGVCIHESARALLALIAAGHPLRLPFDSCACRPVASISPGRPESGNPSCWLNASRHRLCLSIQEDST